MKMKLILGFLLITHVCYGAEPTKKASSGGLSLEGLSLHEKKESEMASIQKKCADPYGRLNPHDRLDRLKEKMGLPPLQLSGAEKKEK